MSEAARAARVVAAIKVVHSVFFLLMTLSLLMLLVSAVSGWIGVWTWIAAVTLFVEGAVLILNRKRCPLTGLTERLGAEDGRVTTIFLPSWLVPWTFEVYAALTALAVLLLAVRLAG